MRRPPVHGPWSNLVLQRGSKCHCYLIYLFICSVGSSRHPDQIQIRIVIWFSTSYDSEMPIVSRPLPTYYQERTHFHHHFTPLCIYIPHNQKFWELVLQCTLTNSTLSTWCVLQRVQTTYLEPWMTYCIASAFSSNQVPTKPTVIIFFPGKAQVDRRQHQRRLCHLFAV
jgi:hypothetical protein